MTTSLGKKTHLVNVSTRCSSSPQVLLPSEVVRKRTFHIFMSTEKSLHYVLLCVVYDQCSQDESEGGDDLFPVSEEEGSETEKEEGDLFGESEEGSTEEGSEEDDEETEEEGESDEEEEEEEEEEDELTGFQAELAARLKRKKGAMEDKEEGEGGKGLFGGDSDEEEEEAPAAPPPKKKEKKTKKKKKKKAKKTKGKKKTKKSAGNLCDLFSLLIM